ncbi:Lysosomal protective protein [Trichoplax sp. H2]|nr:Lysosomal protective protein [Trichoplax sp. H2]|eukprot:RDD38003.1 Lysosomal protective protein [Trichoplax sp. H2]
MTKQILLSAGILAVAVLSIAYAAPKNPDLVKSLPGLPHPPSFKHYSGYLKGLKTNQLHYWFAEATKNPSQAPLILWLNGGPGCSSLDGFLTEHGPFGVHLDSTHLYYRTTSWNKFANVLYLESPAGVGFSYNMDKDYAFTDNTTAANNYAAIKNFFQKFPQFKKNDFYITGESYAGIYVPTLVARIINDSSIKLKGFAIGNGVISSKNLANSIIYYYYYHGFFGTDLWEQLQKHCCKNGKCNFYNPSSMMCLELIAKAQIPSSIDTYNVYGDCFDPDQASVIDSVKRSFLSAHLFGKFQSAANGQPIVPCINSTAETFYLNRKDVRKALHISPHAGTWHICSNAVGAKYQSQYAETVEMFPSFLKKVRGLVYNGDVDTVCNFLGDQWAVRSLKRKVIKPRQPWFYKDINGKQVGGFVERYDKIDFLTIRGAGHTVPALRPQQAYQMMYNFINNKPYSTAPKKS